MQLLRKFLVLIKYSWYNTKKDFSWFLQISISPFFFALISLYMFKESKVNNYASYVLLGTTIMGMWISTLIGTGSEIRKDRINGTLQLILVSPTSLYMIILTRSIIHTLLGLVSVFEIYLISFFMLRETIILHNIWLILCIIIISAFSFAILGLILSAAFFFLSEAVTLSNILTRLIYVISGVMFPIGLLPLGIRWIGYAFSTTWSVLLLREVALENLNISSVVTKLFIIILLTIFYIIVSMKLFNEIEKHICKTAEFRRV